jgi:hypothetical protein
MELESNGPSLQFTLAFRFVDVSIMSRRAADFLEQWLSENAVRPVPGAPDSEARLRAEECLRAAKEENIAQEDIEEEVGDLASYMSGVIAELITRSEPSNTAEEDREQRIRNKAYHIWLEEGCPEGRAEAHWDMATELVAIEENYSATLKPVQDGRSKATGEPVEPLLSIENAGEFPTLTDQGEENMHPATRATKKRRLTER